MRDAARDECAERLTGRAGKLDRDRCPGGNPSSPYFFAMRLDIIVPTVRFTFRIGKSSVTLFPSLDRRLAQLDQLVIEHVRETVVLFLHTIAGNLRPHIWCV